jgi:hypothetical protein
LVKDGLITECVIEVSEQLRKMSERFLGCRHMVGDLTELLRNENHLFYDIDVFNFF